MRRGTDAGGPDRRGTWRSAVAGVAALALILTPGVVSAEPGGGGGGGEPTDEAVGNNLKMPVIWAEDVGPELRGDGPQTAALLNVEPITKYEVVGEKQEAELILTPADGTYVVEDGQALFLQQIVGNTWQAENRTLTETGLKDPLTGQLPVTYVDWGDNLEVKPWSTKQKIRVETRLLQDVSTMADPDVAGPDGAGFGMTGYLMDKLDDTPSGPGEMWGAVAEEVGGEWLATEQQVNGAFVYTGKACLTIERVDETAKLDWNADDRTWTGTSVLKTCLGDSEGGLDGLGAEVTISGGMTYGSVWDPGDVPDGLYRMTFSLRQGSGADQGSGVDITEDSAIYHGELEPDATAVAAEAEADEGDSGAQTPNVAVLRPDLDLTFIDVPMGFSQGKPTRPVNLTASPDVESMALAWDPPVYDGSSEITGYVVTAAGFAGFEVPEGTENVKITGLPGGVARTFSVVAVNDAGVSDPTSVVATPLAKTSPTPPPTTPPSATPPSVTPPTEVGQAVTVRLRAVSGGKKLYVNVGPNMGRGYYQFTVQKLSGGQWRTLPKVYKTYGNGETRRLRLAKGTYRVIVLPRYGYEGMTSEVVSLRRATPSVLPAETEQAVTMTTRATSRESKLYVNVDPNMGKGYWQFVVQKLSSGQWRALSKVYKTKANAERRTLNLRKGTYRVIVMPRYGLQGAMSDTVGLRR